MNALGAYNRDGRAHFERVVRSWEVLRRNAAELVGHVRTVEADAWLSMQLAQAPLIYGPTDNDVTREFWSVLDQRLHNLVSSATSLVDHTRPLVSFYQPHEPGFAAEWQVRSDAVKSSPRAEFLRRLRNYLLHFGMAPTMHTLGLQAGATSAGDNLTIQLSGAELLEWTGWTPKSRDFIKSFDGGPPLTQVTLDYMDDMVILYKWLHEQQEVLHPAGRPQARFYIPWPPNTD